jgi:hypothetical protein
LHILCRDTAGTAIGIVNDGNAEIIDCERDGSYLICDMSAPYTFVILNKEGKALPVTIIILCAGILAFLAAGTVTVRRKRRLRAAKDKNEDTDTTPDDVEEEPDNSDGDTSGDAEEVIYLEPDDVIDAEDDE